MPADRAAADLAKSPMPSRITSLGFELVNYPNPFAVAIPFWFLVSLMGTLAAALWFKKTWRFSLRTMLLTASLFALALAILVAAAH
jgi:hypothetical protein